ncbi:MAG: hypothetical protein L6R39_007601 [Caloplaca ligustica]|nr:MAG: hypothetical protein L6R39_007601 [Caloplaca ligustica]
MQWIMATFAACPASYYFVKLSILFFYLRVFELQAKLRYIIYAMFVYCTIYYGVAFFAIIGLCNVRNRAWDITVTMNCFAYGKLTFAIGGLDLVADVIVLVFPIPQVLKLQISWPQKIYLLVIFLFGLTASAACAIRLAWAVQFRNTTDATMAQYHVVTMFCIEHYLALIAACMPTLGPFFRFLRPSRLKQVVKGHKPLREDVGGPWSRPGTIDHSLMYGSVLRSEHRGNDLRPAESEVALTTMGKIDEEHAMKDLGKPKPVHGRDWRRPE